MRKALIVAAVVVAGGLAVAHDGGLPGDARRGAQLFGEKRCLACHSFRGEGGGLAPDLGRRTAREYTPASLAASLWNHGPGMWRLIERLGMELPALAERDVADLFAYFYSVLYFDGAADAARGKAVFKQKKCAQCHALGTAPAGDGPPVVQWKAVSDPIALAREMWNHSGTMMRKMSAARLSWPEITAQEFADLLVFLQNLPETRSSAAIFSPADPQEGRTVFEAKGCGDCHTIGVRAAGMINLAIAETPRSMSYFIAAMWNHAPQMDRLARGRETVVPKFSGAEMNHLIAYLFWARYFEQKGDAAQGRRVFVRKNCAVCHKQKSARGAPNMAALRERADPIAITAALWEHGPRMVDQVRKQKLSWPQMTAEEVAHLLAYLASGK